MGLGYGLEEEEIAAGKKLLAKKKRQLMGPDGGPSNPDEIAPDVKDAFDAERKAKADAKKKARKNSMRLNSYNMVPNPTGLAGRLNKK